MRRKERPHERRRRGQVLRRDGLPRVHADGIHHAGRGRQARGTGCGHGRRHGTGRAGVWAVHPGWRDGRFGTAVVLDRRHGTRLPGGSQDHVRRHGEQAAWRTVRQGAMRARVRTVDRRRERQIQGADRQGPAVLHGAQPGPASHADHHGPAQRAGAWSRPVGQTPAELPRHHGRGPPVGPDRLPHAHGHRSDDAAHHPHGPVPHHALHGLGAHPAILLDPPRRRGPGGLLAQMLHGHDRREPERRPVRADIAIIDPLVVGTRQGIPVLGRHVQRGPQAPPVHGGRPQTRTGAMRRVQALVRTRRRLGRRARLRTVLAVHERVRGIGRGMRSDDTHPRR